MRFSKLALAASALLALGAATGCSTVRAQAAFKDGNKFYKEENFKKAIEEYTPAVELEPASRRRSSSWAAPTRPSSARGTRPPRTSSASTRPSSTSRSPSSRTSSATENQKNVRTNTLAALAGIYSEPPKQNATKAFEYMSQLLQEAPNDAKNLYAIANLHEKFNQIPEAEAAYKKVAELNPNDAKACAALATFYNKPLWEGRSRFDDATATLERCANLDPNDATGFHKVAQFFWDKAYRDPLLNDAQKEQYADKGLDGGREVAADQARLLGGPDHEGPALPGEGHGGEEPEGAQRVPRAGRHHPEAGPRAAQAAAGRGGRRGGARCPPEAAAAAAAPGPRP